MFTYALLGGVLPALLWMWFWMHENYKHDEPKWIIALTFICGMCAVFLVYPIQKLFPDVDFGSSEPGGAIGGLAGLFTISGWAFVEELFKYGAAFFCALHVKNVFNEPIDAFIYLMTAALGFTALENTFYLLAPLLQGDTVGSIMTGNLRFMGASLLHVVASGSLAICLGFSFYKSKFVKFLYFLVGITIATIIHTLFNYFIIITTEGSTFLIFSFVWLTTIILIITLDRVKTIKKF